MRLLFVSLYFHPASAYGGPVASTWSLSKALAEQGAAVRVLTTDADGPRRLDVHSGWQRLAPGIEARYARRLGTGLFAPSWLVSLAREIRRADAVYLSGLMVWALPWITSLARISRTPVMIAPRGMALPEALDSKSAKKRAFLAVAKLCGLRRATFHATSEAEAEALRTLLGRALPRDAVVTVPNGVEIPSEETLAAIAPRSASEPPYLLYLGRFHPHKQPELLIEAFARWTSTLQAPEGDGQTLHLRMVGPDEGGLRARLRAQAAAAGLEERISIEPAVAGAEKSRLLANATALVLASKSENFGMSVAEALAHATPCLVTHTAPWPGLEAERCGLWVEPKAEALAEGIRRLLSTPADELRASGRRGRAWMQRDFAWPSLAHALLRRFELSAGA